GQHSVQAQGREGKGGKGEDYSELPYRAVLRRQGRQLLRQGSRIIDGQLRIDAVHELTRSPKDGGVRRGSANQENRTANRGYLLRSGQVKARIHRLAQPLSA